jgi:alpha-tubulin suppressor-like RCC1 family protein
MIRLLTIFIYLLVFQVQQSVAQCFTQISVGSNHSLALKSDGSLWACGNNSVGQLGNGTTTSKLIFTKIGNSTDWDIIETGNSVSFGIKKDGSLWAWGNNGNTALGDGTKVSKSTPVKIESDQSWKSVSTFDSHTLGIKKDGTLWAWGKNTLYQLGLGNSTTDRPKPTQVGIDKDWMLVAAGKDFSIATKKDGSLWAWGNNYYYTLGSGQLSGTKKVPTLIDSGVYTSISAVEYHAAGLQSDGTAWTWGSNEYGQMGNGTIENNYFPTSVGSLSEWKDIKVGTIFTIGLKKDGTVWTWGRNNFGELGTNNSSFAPVKLNISATITINSISVGHYDTYAFDNKGGIWFFGRNNGGLLGTGLATSVQAPQLLNCTSVGVDDEKMSSLVINLYPNPVSNELFVDFEDEKNELFELLITDVLGKTLYQQSSFDKNMTIDTESLPKGYYVVTLRSKSVIGFKKFNKI